MAKSGKSKPQGASRTKTAAQPEQASDKPPGPYLVLARKYRPQTFDDLIGQDAMVRTLRNAFAMKRIAQAYMLTGVRGVGKTTTARILARALNYSVAGEDTGPQLDMPGEGEHCRAIMESRHVDVIEMDAASHTGIDDIREITDSIRYKPAYARYKVFIIDEVHMLSKAAFNGLLKTLEEPPEHVKFIFATTEVRKVPVTVLSRCQRFDLRRVETGRLAEHFAAIASKEGRKVDAEALALLARAAEGSVRDGLSLLDQALAHAAGEVSAPDVRAMLGLADRQRVFALLEAILAGQAARALDGLKFLYDDGAEPERIIAALAQAVHAISRIAAAGAPGASADLAEAEAARAGDLAGRLDIAALARAWQMLLKGLDEVSRAPDALAAAEMLVIRMCYVADLPPPERIIRMLEDGAGADRIETKHEQSTNESASQDVPLLSLAAQVEAAQVEAPQDGPAAVHADQGGADLPQPASFAEVAELAGARRDIRLKLALEENVQLVAFRPGHIELRLLKDAPGDLANQLGRKLNEWTGARWLVSISDRPGQPSLGEERRAREARMLDEVKQHPLVRDVLKHFPDAEIIGVSDLNADCQSDRTSGAGGAMAQNEERNDRFPEHDEAGQRAAKQNGRDAGPD